MEARTDLENVPLTRGYAFVTMAELFSVGPNVQDTIGAAAGAGVVEPR